MKMTQPTLPPMQTNLPLKTGISLIPQVPVKTSIKDLKSTSNHGIILISTQTMQDIYTKSGPLAKSNEFQTHYWFLNLRHKASDGSILDIAIPTVYYNYKQQVSGARIDFEMKDVSDISAKVIPIHNMKVNELLKTSLISDITKYFGVEFTVMSVDVGSIHRHPGSSKSQAFSGTDLCTTAADHGVVYPFGTAYDDKPNFAGIMAIDAGTCNVAHYEYRTANGELGKNITYTKGRCSAIIVNDSASTLSIVEKLFQTSNYSIKENNSLLSQKDDEALANIFLNSGFRPFTDSVVPENVTAAVSSYSWENWGKLGLSKSLKPAVAKPKIDKPIGLDLKLVETMNEDVLLTHLKELDLYYYSRIDEADYVDLTKEEIISAIREMYVAISEEEEFISAITDKSPTLEEMRKDLIDFGVAPSVLVTATEEQIRTWHGNA